MVTTIILTGLISLINALLVGFLVFKGVQLGLRWQVEVRQERPPTLERPKLIPFEPFDTGTKQAKETESLLDEWVNGADERR